MICVGCLLLLVPIVNLLPLIFHSLMAKVYALFGSEYRKPEGSPQACPYKPAASNNSTGTAATEAGTGTTQTLPKPSAEVEGKQD